MKTCRGVAVRVVLYLCSAVLTPQLYGEELTTYYAWGGVTYDSLQAAEAALWNSPWFGSSYYTFKEYDPHRRYHLPPTTDYTLNEKLVFSSVPGAPCGNGPLTDEFGNDWCSGVPSGGCCASTADWRTAVKSQFSSQDCALQLDPEEAWVEGVTNDISYPRVYPEEYIIIFRNYSTRVQGRFGEGTTSLCGRELEWSLSAIAPGHCPGGYDLMQNAVCDNWRLAFIVESGAEAAEQSNSCSVENPCHPATGDKTLSETDFNSRTLTLTRHYHSRQNYKEHAGMGKGWSHSYSGRLMASGDTIKLMDERGSVERYRCTDPPTCSLYSSESESGNLLRPLADGWVAYLKTGERHEFDAQGRLMRITDRSGSFREVTVHYNTKSQVESVIDQSGRSLQFNYNSMDLVESITLPDGNSIRYEYVSPPTDRTQNARFNLVKAIYQDLTERAYRYEHADGSGAQRYGHLLTGIVDENGVMFASYTYDDSARVTSSQHAEGADRVTLHYTNRPGDGYSWSITDVTMPLGEVVTYDMEPGPFRKIESLEDSRGTVAITYDPITSWRTSKTDREGNRTIYRYADGLHETSRIEAAGTADARSIETDWDNAINRVAEIREPGTTTTFTHNARGQILSRTVQDSATLAASTWTYHYFEPPALAPLVGQIAMVDGPRTDVPDITAFEYYTADHARGDYLIGDLKAVVNALGHRTEYLKYDFNGRPLEISDANNVLTVITYHPRGWMNSKTIDGKTTSFSYDKAGNLTRITQPDGSFVDYEYDDAHRLEAMSDADGNRMEYTLDAAGNRVAERTYNDSGVLRHQLSKAFNTLNQLERLVDGNNDQIRFSYDKNGNRTGMLDANSNTTRYEFDAFDRLTRTIDAMLGETEMAYDERDNLASIIDPLGNVTRYSHDGLDNLIELNSPDTGTATYLYDEAGNRTAAVDNRRIRVEYDYDALNRLTNLTHPDRTLDVRFSYDSGTFGKGRLTGMTDSAGSVNYQYDARGNLIRESRSIGNTEYAVSYGFNSANRLTRVTYPSGMIVDYRLDTAGRIIAVDKTIGASTERLAEDIQYEPFGPMKSFTYGNDLSYLANFDLDYQLDRLRSGDDLDWLFGMDAAGNTLALDDQFDDRLDQTFSYDALHRLTTARGGYGTERFDYDANGNRTRYRNSLVDTMYNYSSGSNQLAVQGDWAIIRDAAGNRTGKLDAFGYGRLYAFDDHNRLRETVVRNGGGDAVVGVYEYDGRGQRIVKTANGTTTHFVYGPSGELLGEYAEGSVHFTEYVYINGQPVALHRSVLSSGLAETVVDNLDSGASGAGEWKHSKSVRGFWGADYQYQRPGALPSAGVIIDNGDSGFSVTGAWPNSTAVRGFEGDDYQFHAPRSFPPGAVIIDDGDASTLESGSWTESTSVGGYHGAQYHYHARGIGENSYTWSLNAIPAGEYRIYARWTAHANRASNARYDVHHAGGAASVTVDQQTNGGQWNLLGTFTIDPESLIVLTDEANGYVIADAIQLVEINAPPNSASWSPALTAGNYRIYARWTAHRNRASDATYAIEHSTGTSEVMVNQRKNGRSWQLLGAYDLDEDSSVTLTDQANGYVIADALYFVPSSAPYNAFTWDPGIINEGEYEVFARWTAHRNRTSHAVYSVHHAGGTTDVTLDQRRNGGTWISLGTYTLDEASQILLLQQDDGYTIADAIRVKAEEIQSHSGTFYIHTDHLGTPRRVSDAMQTTVWRWDSSPFGDLPANEDPDGDSMGLELNLRFPGQYFDSESGLHYNYFRDYDPGIGRYVESDPIGLGGGVNTYAYVENQPINYLDVYGLYQMCHRPVQGPVPGRHCYAVFADGSTSSFSKSGVGPEKDRKHLDTKCNTDREPQKDDCIRKAMKRCEGLYDFIRFNCCHCVEQALKACGASIPDHEWPNYPINPGPQPGEPGYSRLPVFGPNLGDDQ